MDGFGDDERVVVVAAFLTVCFSAFDVLPPNFESPTYTAVMKLVPTGSAEVVELAEPPLNVPVPSTVEPCLNRTVSPSGGAPRPEVTTAVKVTACP